MLRSELSTAVLVSALVTTFIGGCAAVLSIDEFQDRSGSGGAAGASAGGAGATSSGGGGNSSGAESCLDRVDNNADGLADCEDPLCQIDHECVPLTTGNWLGIGWLYEDDPAADCPLGQRLELFEEIDLVVPPASCACGCEEPTTTSCEATVYCSTLSCGGQTSDTGTATDACSPLVLNSVGEDCWVHSLQAMASPCAVAPVLTGNGPQWSAAGSVCVYADGGHCAGQDTCVPQGTATARGPCVAQQGEHTCPAEYTEQLLFWDGTWDDQRSCSAAACSCASPTGATCGCGDNGPCGVTGYTNSACSQGNQFALMDGSSCLHYGAFSPPEPPFNVGMRLVGAEVTAQGSCSPSGTSQLVGEVLPAARITVCCASE